MKKNDMSYFGTIWTEWLKKKGRKERKEEETKRREEPAHPAFFFSPCGSWVTSGVGKACQS